MEYLFLATDGTTVTLVAIGIILVFALVGTIMGFWRMLFKTFGTVLAILLAALLCSLLTKALENWFGFITKLSNSIANGLDNIFGKEVLDMTVGEIKDAQSIFDLSTSGNKISIWVINILLKVKKAGVSPDLTVRAVLAPTFAYYALLVIVGVALFIIFKILFFILDKLIEKLLKKKNGVSAANRILGAVLGVLRGILCVQIISLIIGIIPFNFMQSLNGSISASPFVGFLNKINLLEFFLERVLDLFSIIAKFVVVALA